MLELKRCGAPPDDWFYIANGVGWAFVEGPSAEWLAVADAMRSGSGVYFKRLAAQRQDNGFWQLWSPRNASSPSDCELLPPEDVAAFADHIEAVVKGGPRA